MPFRWTCRRGEPRRHPNPLACPRNPDYLAGRAGWSCSGGAGLFGCWGLRFDELVGERVADEVGTARHAELLLDVGPVRLDRTNRQVQLRTNFDVGVSKRDQAQNVKFSLRETVGGTGRRLRGDARAKSRMGIGTADRGALDGLDKLLLGALLENVAERP